MSIYRANVQCLDMTGNIYLEKLFIFDMKPQMTITEDKNSQHTHTTAGLLPNDRLSYF